MVWIPLRITVQRAYFGGEHRYYSHDVAVDDLDHDQGAIVGHDIKGLGLHIGILVGAPPKVILGELRVGYLLRLGLLGDGSDGVGAIDGFLSACDTGETKTV